MSMESSLRGYLISLPAISTLVGQRVYAVSLPQGGAYPAVTYRMTSSQNDYAMFGPSEMSMPKYEIDSYATTSEVAGVVAAAIKKALDRYSGAMGDVIVIQSFAMDGKQEYVEAKKEYYKSRTIVEMWWKEPL